MRKAFTAILFCGIVIGCQVPTRTVYVANPLTRTMKFAIVCGSSGTHSTPRELQPRTSDLYSCSETPTRLRVVTGDKEPLLVALEPKKRYEFYWNTDKSQWDVREVTPR